MIISKILKSQKSSASRHFVTWHFADISFGSIYDLMAVVQYLPFNDTTIH